MIQTVICLCPVCNGPYEASVKRLSFGRQTTCSRQCSYRLRSQVLRVDLTGKPFGAFTVLRRADRRSSSGAWYWRCRCICGVEKDIFCSSLTRGLSTSCGCLGRHNPHTKNAEKSCWYNMIQRCHIPTHKSYHYYGGRGITVCERWRLSYDDFLNDVGRRPSPEHSLDRYPNNNGNYEPGNVRWATSSEQVKNRRTLKRKK